MSEGLFEFGLSWPTNAAFVVSCPHGLQRLCPLCKTAMHFGICRAMKEASGAAFKFGKSRLICRSMTEGVFVLGHNRSPRRTQPSGGILHTRSAKALSKAMMHFGHEGSIRCGLQIRAVFDGALELGRSRPTNAALEGCVLCARLQCILGYAAKDPVQPSFLEFRGCM